MSNISDKAVISPNAKIGNNVTIYPFVYIEDDVVIGDNCIIYPYVSIMNGARIGNGNKIHQNTVISAIPQDYHYKGDPTKCIIGDGNIIRENVTINRATYLGHDTKIGNGNFLMEGSHVSHDVRIRDNNVIGYGTKIAGCCKIRNNVILCTSVIVNPDCRFGDCSMVQSGTTIDKDVPPFIVAGGVPVEYRGINLFSVQRQGIDEKVKNHIANAYRLVFHGQDALLNVCSQIRQQIPESPEINDIIQFLENSQIGLITKM